MRSPARWKCTRARPTCWRDTSNRSSPGGPSPRRRSNVGEVVVVTGASAGIGRAIARRFGQAGASVALLARGLDGLEGAAREVEQAGGRALVIPTDVADWEQVNEA